MNSELKTIAQLCKLPRIHPPNPRLGKATATRLTVTKEAASGTGGDPLGGEAGVAQTSTGERCPTFSG